MGGQPRKQLPTTAAGHAVWPIGALLRHPGYASHKGRLPASCRRRAAAPVTHFSRGRPPAVQELVLKDGEVEQLMADAAAAIKRPEFAHLSQCVVWGDHGLLYLKRGCPAFVALGKSSGHCWGGLRAAA